MRRTNPTEPNKSQSARSVVWPMTRSVERIGRHAEGGVRRRILLAQPGRNRIHFRASGRDGCGWPQAAEDDERVGRAAPRVLPVRTEEERLPDLDVRRGQLEPRRHHADDLDRHRSLNWIDSSDHLRIRAEALLPEAVADDDGPRGRREVAGLERAAEQGSRAQELEEARPDLSRPGSARRRDRPKACRA